MKDSEEMLSTCDEAMHTDIFEKANPVKNICFTVLQ